MTSEYNNFLTTSPYPEEWRALILERSARVESGCIEWQAWLKPDGYGVVRYTDPLTGKYRNTGAHRAAWLVFRGDLRPDQMIDHLCRNRKCVNVDHLEPVSNKVNVRRGNRPAPSDLDHYCTRHGQEAGTFVVQAKTGYVKWWCYKCGAERRRRYREQAAERMGLPHPPKRPWQTPYLYRDVS